MRVSEIPISLCFIEINEMNNDKYDSPSTDQGDNTKIQKEQRSAALSNYFFFAVFQSAEQGSFAKYIKCDYFFHSG